MELIVLGSSGGCGREVVKQAVTRGFSVTAVARENSGYTPPEGVKLIIGDVLNGHFIKEIV